MSERWGLVVTVCCLLLLVGCGGTGGESGAEADTAAAASEPPAEQIKRLDALLAKKSGSELTGMAILIQDDFGVSLQLNIENTAPGEHAVHLHEIGDCSADDATSAGGHWNPTIEDHGRWGDPPHHLGDIGNIIVEEDGTGSLGLTTDRWTLGDGSEIDIYGKALIVHAGVDDFTSQPTGAAGGRIGCAVLEIK